MNEYPRASLEGMYLPRAELIGWRVDIGQEVFTNLNPGPIQEVDIELDSIGCLTTASIALKQPRYPVFPAHTLSVKFWVLSKVRGAVPIALGYVAAPLTQDDLNSFSLPVQPLENISMHDYYDGSLAGATGEILEAGTFMQKNDEVVTAALKDRPKASIGVDHTGAVQLAEPANGNPVRVPQRVFYDWKSTGLVTLPYATRSRWDGGPGWLKGEYSGIARPAYAERRAVDAGEVTFTEVTREAGPPLVTVAELIVNPIATPKAVNPQTGEVIFDPDPGMPPVDSLPEAQSGQPGAIQTTPNLIKKQVTAQQYAVVHVYDLQTWYEGSSLPGQGESDLIKQLQNAVNAAQEAFRLSIDVLGPEHAFTQEEQNKLTYSKNQLRLARVGSEAHVSDYEPLSGKLSTGFVLDQIFWHREYPGE